MIAEAMAKVSKPCPAAGSAAPSRAADSTAEKLEQTPEIMNTISV